MKAICKFFDLPILEKVLFFEALFFMYITKFLLYFVSFKSIVKLYSKEREKKSNADENKLEQIKKAVARANQLAFWKNQCLVQSLAARWMLQRRKIPSRLSLGVKLDENKKLIAHAWIRANNFEIVNKNSDYKELTVFE